MAIRYLSGINVDSNTLFVDDANNRVGIGTGSPSYKASVVTANGNYWNGTAFTGIPLALSIENSEPGGYDPVLIYNQADSGGTLKNSGAIGMVGTAAWTAGDNAAQVSDMYFLVRNSSGALQERARLKSNGHLILKSMTSGGGTQGDFYVIENGGLVIDASEGATQRYIEFTTGGTSKALITAGGNLLIGTTTDAGYKLRVNGSSYFDAPILCYTGNAYITAITSDGVGSNNGFGYSFLITGANHEIGRVTGIYETSGGGGSGGLGFWTRGSGTLSTKMTLNSGGTLTLSNYGSGSKTGTPAYNLAVDASGNVIETAGGVVDGSGTANKISKWQDANTLTDANITDNGSTVRINSLPLMADARLAVGTAGADQTYASIFIGGDITTGANQYALILDPQLSGTNNYGLLANARIKASTAATNAYGVYIINNELLSGASVVNNYGLYIANQTSGSSVNYALYSAGGTSYFAGNVGIGTGSPDAIFHVAKAVSSGVGGQIVIDNPSSSAVGNTAELSFLTDAGASGAGTRNAKILAVNVNAGNGAAELQFHTWNGAAELKRMNIASNGVITFGAYGSGNVTGTPTYNLAVDASGNIIETAGGVVDGSGTANYVTKWQDANTVTDSQIVDNGTNVGINNASPKTKLDVNGAIGFGSKTLNISDTFVTVLTVNMSNHTGCYVKITAFGDWSGHSAVAYLGEFFLQNGASAYNEPGVIIRQVDNTNTDDIVAQIVDPAGTGTRDFEIQLKTTSASGVPFSAAIQYEVRGQYNSVS